MSWLLKIGLAGVQDWIAQARKTRDLAAGSRWVAEVAGAILAEGAAPGSGCAPLLPAAGGAAAAPHQLLFRVDGGEKEAKAAGERLAAKAKARWSELAAEGLGWWAARTRLATLARPLAELQIPGSIELYWVAVPESGDYEADFRRISERFDLRRQTRTFAQQPEIANRLGHPPRTCKICGSRVAVLQPGSATSSNGSSRLGSGEYLCGPCAAKRGWTPAGLSPPSTRRLAASRWFGDPAAATLIAELQKSDDGREWLLELEDDPPPPAKAPVPGVAEALGSLRGLSPYYAIVAFDGDEMGQWLSGRKGTAGKLLEQFQTDLSAALCEFAAALQALSTASRGGPYLVYCGGDDALALLGLDDLLPWIDQVGQLWKRKVATPMSSIGQVPSLTLAASVLHAKEPFQPALRRLRALLEEAKEQGGRDCIAIHCRIHSGSEVTYFGDWRDDAARFASLVECLGNWRRTDGGQRPAAPVLTSRRSEAAPGRLPQTLLGNARPLFAAPMSLDEARAFRNEVRRLARQGAMRPAAEALWAPVEEWLLGRCESSYGSGLRRGWTAFEGALKAAEFLARQLDWPLGGTR